MNGRETTFGGLFGERLPAMIAIALASSFVSGCASFRGAQERVTEKDVAAFQPACPSQEQIQWPHPGESNGPYRNRIVLLCIQLISSKYAAFTEELSKEASGTNLSSDVIAQALATGASILKHAARAQKLAAGSALSLGIGAAINKDLFYKQTLPAIVASMDAKRAKVITAILDSENRDPQANVYTLDRAGFDLEAPQQAGSLNNAVQELTSAAVENAADATAAQNDAARDMGVAKPVSADIEARLRAAAAEILSLKQAGQTDKLRLIAEGLGLGPPPGASAQLLAATVRQQLNTVTTTDPARQDDVMKRFEAILSLSKGAGK